MNANSCCERLFGRMPVRCLIVMLCLIAWTIPGIAIASNNDNHATQKDTASQSANESPYLSDWYHQHLSLVYVTGSRFGPFNRDDIYLEYEAAGSIGPFDLYGYADIHKVFNIGIGDGHYTGFWDGGSPLFIEFEPRMSFSRLTNTDLSVGPIKDWFLAVDWILDVGNGQKSRQNTLYFGPGITIDTHTPLYLAINFYFRRQFAYYGAPTSFSWDGYRLQPKFALPIMTFHDGLLDGGTLKYFGFINYDFGSDLGDKVPYRTNHAFVSTNVLVLGFKHLRYWFAARWFHNGGQWQDGATVYFPEGRPRRLDQTGWAFYFAAGWKF